MSGGKVTSLEVAMAAGVSQSAVSRVFTPGASVSEKMAERVQQAAQKLGYHPNSLARSLITGKSKMIGFIVAYLDNQFYPESLQKLSARLQGEGYHLLIFTASNHRDSVAQVVQELLQYQVDAIIAASVSLDTSLTRQCSDAGVPVVLFNRSDETTQTPCVTSDNLEGGRLIAHHLHEIGAKRPAYIAGWEGASTQRDREIGFRRGLKECGQTLFAREVGNFTHEGAKNAARALFSRADKPDAIFVANDHMAFAVMDVARYEFGLRIPQDVATAGYDDVEIAAWPSYNLTSMRQPANRMVDATVDAVLAAIENPNTPLPQTRILGQLIKRVSTIGLKIIGETDERL